MSPNSYFIPNDHEKNFLLIDRLVWDDPATDKKQILETRNRYPIYVGNSVTILSDIQVWKPFRYRDGRDILTKEGFVETNV